MYIFLFAFFKVKNVLKFLSFILTVKKFETQNEQFINYNAKNT